MTPAVRWIGGLVIAVALLVALYAALLPAHPGLTDAEAAAHEHPAVLTPTLSNCFSDTNITLTVPEKTPAAVGLIDAQFVALKEAGPLLDPIVNGEAEGELHNLSGRPAVGTYVWVFDVTPAAGINEIPQLKRYTILSSYPPVCAVAIVSATGKPLGLRIG